jgi:hypothetical protein
MPRHASTRGLDKRATRLRLPVARKPTFVTVGPGVSIGYRRNNGAGTWVARVANGAGGSWTKAVGNADDLADANGADVLDFWQASSRARTIARPAGEDDVVAQAIDNYEANLRTRGGDTDNAARIRFHLPDALAAKTVALLTVRDLRHWRDGLIKHGLASASVNRTARVLKAALTSAADADERIGNQRTWKRGLAHIPHSSGARNRALRIRGARGHYRRIPGGP